MKVLADPVQRFTCGQCNQSIDAKAMKPLTVAECPHCKARVEVPGRLDHFNLLSELKREGAGRLFKSIDTLLQRRVAILVLPRTSAADGKVKKAAKAALEQVRKQAAISHDRIVQIYRIGDHNGQPFVVMPLLENNSTTLMKDGPMPESAALSLAADVVEGLITAETRGLVHMNIHPEAVLLDSFGRGVVGDFGMAGFDPAIRTRGYIGQPAYVSPEVAIGQTPNFHSDCYNLGATLFEWLTGAPPFAGDDEQVVEAKLAGPAPSILHVRGDLNPMTAALIDRLLSMQPSPRAQSYPALMQELSDVRYAVDTNAAAMMGHPGPSTIQPMDASDPAAALAAAAVNPPTPTTESTGPSMQSAMRTIANTAARPTGVAGVLFDEAGNAIERRRRAGKRGVPLVAILVPAGVAVVIFLGLMVWLVAGGDSHAESPGDGDPVVKQPDDQGPTAPAPKPPDPFDKINAQANQADGLVAHWSFDQAQGKKLYDATGNLEGQMMGGATLVKGRVGKALKLSKKGDFVAVKGFRMTTDEATFAGWFKPAGAQPRDAGLLMSRPKQKEATGLNINHNGGWGYHWLDLRETWGWRAGPKVQGGKWQFVALVVTPKNATVYRFSDGKWVKAVNTLKHPLFGIHSIDIGRDSHDGGRYFTGLIDEARIYHRALSEQEVRKLVGKK